MSNSPTTYVHDGACVAASAQLGDFVVVYPDAAVGANCRVRGFTQVWAGVKLHDDVELGPGVTFEAPAGETSDIVIGAGVCIGAGALICRGVRIGQGAEVVAGAHVAQNVPPYAIVAGAPARVVNYVQQAQSQIQSERHTIASFPGTPSTVRLGVGDVTLHRFKYVRDPRGDLSVGEFEREIPFAPKRYFLVMNVPNDKIRGEHAHYKCHQFLVCVKGSCAVVVDDLTTRVEVRLDAPDQGLYLPPMTWGIQYKYSADAVMMVFASHYYEAEDYIRDYDDYVAAKSRMTAQDNAFSLESV
jgi:carbonic anhydrase/acetyltransferase-like protein (isoleucine patch superfamily)